MKQTIYFLAASMFIVAACTKPNKPPVACSESVTFQGKHICFGYLLQRTDGSYLRTFEYAPNSGYESILAGTKIGEVLIIGYTGPQEQFTLDCAVVDTTYSKKIRIMCLAQPEMESPGD